jgi:hypothetical protein
MKCLRVLSAETFGVHKIVKILHFRTLVPNIKDTGPIDALTAFIRTKNTPALPDLMRQQLLTRNPLYFQYSKEHRQCITLQEEI